jgi:hypothetical protein
MPIALSHQLVFAGHYYDSRRGGHVTDGPTRLAGGAI